MKKIALGLLFLISACASTPDTGNMSAEELYNLGYDQMQDTAWAKAAATFEKLELEHPYSAWATKSKLMSAYAYYRDEKYDDAVIALDRFIHYHPGNKDAAYAYYMRGLCYYDQIVGAQKDQDNTAKAKEAFGQLLARFPQTEYADDARAKMNRFSAVVKDYQTTPQIEEALYRLVEIYTILGLKEDAAKPLKVLAVNYPDSTWYKKAVDLTK